MNGKKKTVIDVGDDEFGTVLTCAVRYSLGRQTYMPRLVMDFIRPLIPQLSSKALNCFVRDITEAEWNNMLGDPNIDAPEWLMFRMAVNDERRKRHENE